MVEQTYKEIYNKFRDEIEENSSEAMNAVREEAYEVFERMGFPTTDQERYRRSDIRSIFETNYGLNIKRIAMPLANDERPYRCHVPGLDAYTVYVVNDAFVSDVNAEEYVGLRRLGVVFGSLRSVAKERPDLIGKYYAKAAPHREDGLIAFNSAFAQDGFFMYVPKGVVVDKPVQLINVMRAGFDFLAVSRNLIVADEGASVKVMVCDHCDESPKFLSDRVTEVMAEKDSNVSLHRVVETERNTANIGAIYVKQKANSTTLFTDIVLRSSFSREDFHINLSEEGAETTLCGIAIADEHDHIDNDTFIEHSAANCKSTELYKYVLDDCAVGSFAGRILVDQDSQKTTAYQSNKNICASKTARMYTKPQLVIYADDVKCSHGATVGQIDDAQLFYLRSRGISEKEAKMLLMQAFTNDIVEKIDIEPLRMMMRQLIEKRFRRETHKCSACHSCRQ